MSAASLLAVVVTEPTTVEVLPAQTVLATWDVKNDHVLTIQVDNEDSTQTFSGIIQRKLHDDVGWVNAGETDLSSIPPLTGACVDVNFGAARYLRLVGTMDGEGGDVIVTATRRAAR